MTPQEKHELHYLRWFKASADFGPADDDVHDIMNEDYTRETGRAVPREYDS